MKRNWDKPCDNCQVRKSSGKTQVGSGIGKRMPAAVVVDEEGKEHFVDKFGVEVKDHGYDLQNDPRGWKKNGYLPTKKTVIL